MQISQSEIDLDFDCVVLNGTSTLTGFDDHMTSQTLNDSRTTYHA